jgi:hypothetical protein
MSTVTTGSVVKIKNIITVEDGVRSQFRAPTHKVYVCAVLGFEPDNDRGPQLNIEIAMAEMGWMRIEDWPPHPDDES